MRLGSRESELKRLWCAAIEAGRQVLTAPRRESQRKGDTYLLFCRSNWTKFAAVNMGMNIVIATKEAASALSSGMPVSSHGC